MNGKKLLLAAMLAGMFAPAWANAALAEADEPRTERHIVTRQGDDVRVEVDNLQALVAIHGAGPTLRAGKLVKNAPYSAEAISERQQNLSDGNQIVNLTNSASYRDSAGRTRNEMRDRKGELRMVTIHDPVEKVTYLLRPRDKSATRIAIDPQVSRAAGDAARARIEQLRKEGKLPEIKVDGEKVIVKRVERVERGDVEVHRDVRVRIAPALPEGGRAMREMGLPLVAGAMGDAKWSSKASTRDLGARDINGVKAEGKQRSYEIPAGEVGNRNPIVVTTETWYSPELQMVLYSKHSDPRHGDIIYRLENLKREEPAASLFTIPSDYTVKDMNLLKRRAKKDD
jgi:hypothetical protein